jgi:23S rRNA pseudouridine1911/1915/1917 synthase
MGLFGKDRDLNRAPDRVELCVDASAMGMKVDDVHVRLDNFLQQHLSWRSRSSIQRLVKDGWLFVDAATPDHPHGSGDLQQETRPGRKLKHGSRVVVIIPPELRLPEPEGETGDVVVLYEDEACIAVDKPPMLPVHPSGRHVNDTLIQRVHARHPELLERGRAPRLCHRLDRETSGIVLVAKDPRFHPELSRQFEDREVEKEYLAVVRGVPTQDCGSIEMPIGPARASAVRLKMAVQADGLPSRTDWRVVERRAEHALLAVRLFTGRQHQIRVHLAAIGHPIVGDKLYAYDESYFQRSVEGALTDADWAVLELPRQALHNHRLVFTSPATRAAVEVVAPLPADLADFLEAH